MFQTLRGDIGVVKSRDPATRSTFTVLFASPGFRAVRMYRRAHFYHTHGLKLLARLVSDACRFRTGVEIHPAAVIGKRLFIDHGAGVVIGETSVIGDDVTLYQGATLGGTGKDTGKRHPTLSDHVVVSAGASVLGPVSIGDHAKIGAGAVVLSDVPRCSTVVGVPGRVVRRYGCPVPCEEAAAQKKDCPCADADTCVPAGEAGVDLDQVHLPDPVWQALTALQKRVDALETEHHGNNAPK